MHHNLINIDQKRNHFVGLCGDAAEPDHLAGLSLQQRAAGQCPGELRFFKVNLAPELDRASSEKAGFLAAGFVSQTPDNHIREVRSNITEVRGSSNLKKRFDDRLSFFVFKAFAGDHQNSFLDL